jgi:hypothetical protein
LDLVRRRDKFDRLDFLVLSEKIEGPEVERSAADELLEIEKLLVLLEKAIILCS